MTVAEAIIIQKEFVANKYHIFRYHNEKLKESMKVLTKAYSNLWDYLEDKEPEVLDRFIDNLIKEEAKDEQSR